MNRNNKRRKSGTVFISLASATLLIAGLVTTLYAKREVAVNNSEQIAQTRVQEDQREIKEYRIQSGDTFSTVMQSFGISGIDASKMIDASKGIYDFTRIKTGQVFKMIFIQNAFAATEYVITDHELLTIEKVGEDFTVKESDIKYDIKPTVAEATITSSLFIDGQSAGLEDKTIMELADLFGWDVDFTTDIREGDSFKVMYEKRSLDGEPVKSGKILGAWFENQGQKYWAILYKDPDGKEKYYDLDGKSVARQFLKSSLDYKYISTQYTNQRVNPVTKKLDTHRAIDFAAPSGTPVVATADGTVVYADWKGGYGIDVEIKHDNSYKTLNAHLSKIAKGIKNGVTVEQGQVIGYVGSTGISTGPHLHFAMYKGGTPINPLTAELPRGVNLNSERKNDFDKKKAEVLKFL